MLESGIYKITNLTNNNIYIGSASNYDKRRGTHISLLRKGNHKNPYLQNAFNKYSEKSFIFELMEKVEDISNLLKREQFWIDFYKSYEKGIGYNISRIAGSNLGNKMSKEAKEKIGNFWRGKKFSQERIDSMRKSRTENQGRGIIVYDKNMNRLHEFASISETSRQLRVSIAAICRQAKNLTGSKRVYKTSTYIFRYI